VAYEKRGWLELFTDGLCVEVIQRDAAPMALYYKGDANSCDVTQALLDTKSTPVFECRAHTQVDSPFLPCAQ
jgi:hypothetical protein